MYKLLMPKLGLTMTSGTIQEWMKSEGDLIKQGEEILMIETDKSSSGVEAPLDGTLYRILSPDSGTEKEIGEVIAFILEPGELPPADDPLPVKPMSQEEVPQSVAEVTQASEKVEVTANLSDRELRKVSPAAKQLARDLGLNLDGIPASGQGFVKLSDVRTFSQNMIAGQVRATPMARKLAAEAGLDIQEVEHQSGSRIYADDVRLAAFRPAHTALDTELPMTNMRRTIAIRMSQSKQEVPHFYLSLDVDMTQMMQLVKKLDFKASVHDVLIKVLAVSLLENARLNAHVLGGKILLKQEINVGVAVALEDGLIVPVVKNAGKKRLKQIAHESAELIQKARDGKLQPDEYQGGTITISNLGMYQIENFFAIINQPEAAIIGVGSMMEKPVVRDGNICIRKMMNISGSFDHRAVDGAVGARFMQRVKTMLENPMLMM